jgi:alginate O-acetyltransferase complex protein AlgI
MPEPGTATTPTRRYLLAWAALLAGLVGPWCCRPWLDMKTFGWVAIIALMGTWKVATLLCLPPGDWARFPWYRLVAYCVWFGMQPRLFLVGYEPDADAPRPTLRSLLLNAATGEVLLWLVPRVLPASTPLTVRVWIGLVGFGFIGLMARFDFYALVFRVLGIPVEKLFVCPVAATTLGEFWGQRWNRIVSEMFRDVVFRPAARRAGARLALFVVFLYSGLYHEITSFVAGSGYGGPTAYFLLQFLGVALENIRPVRRWLRSRPWVGRAWTLGVVVLPCGLLLHPGFVDRVVVPMLEEMRVPGLAPPP